MSFQRYKRIEHDEESARALPKISTQEIGIETSQSFKAVLTQAAVEACPDGILAVGPAGEILIVNRRFIGMWQIPEAFIQAGVDEPILQHVTFQVCDPLGFVARVKYLYDHPGEEEHDEIETLDGRTIDRHSCAIFDRDNHYVGRIWFFRDISERKAAEQKIAALANIDILTGLANRLSFTEQFNHQLAMFQRNRTAFAILYLDLDHFKSVNDTYGHAAGDGLLRQVAERIRETVRPADIVARLGGDEFVLLQTDISDSAASASLAERLIDRISEPFDIAGNRVHIGTSIGIAMMPLDGDNADSLLQNADVAMYRAKTAGRSNYCFFEFGGERQMVGAGGGGGDRGEGMSGGVLSDRAD